MNIKILILKQQSVPENKFFIFKIGFSILETVSRNIYPIFLYSNDKTQFFLKYCVVFVPQNKRKKLCSFVTRTCSQRVLGKLPPGKIPPRISPPIKLPFGEFPPESSYRKNSHLEYSHPFH